MIHPTDLLPRRPIWSIALVSILAGGVLFLAALQYQWIGRLTEAERERLQAGLASSVGLFRESYNRELTQLCSTFRRDPFPPSTDDLAQYARLYEDWRDGAQHPTLVEDLFIGSFNTEGRLTVSRYDEDAKELRPTSGQGPFESMVRACGPSPLPAGTDEGRFRRTGFWSLVFVDRQPFLMRPMYRFQLAAGPASRGPMPPNSFGAPPGLRMRSPGPSTGFTAPPGPPMRSPGPPAGYLFLALNGQYVHGRFLPELGQRIFGDPSHSSFKVAVFLGNKLTDAVYSSDQQPVASANRQYDARVNLLWDPDGRQPGPGRPPAGTDPGQFPFRPAALISACDPEMTWVLAVRHQAGSVDLAARSLWRRNLAVSAAVLILLTLSVLLIVISSQRTQRLARLQMEFAAGISHEVRTPLAVISSAGDNLAEGVVVAPEQVREYGSLVRREARRLSGMVEQTLRFAAMQARSLRYDLSPVDARQVVQGALAELAPILDEGGYRVEEYFQETLPLVLADPGALSRCVQNLVTNALKYGGDDRKVTVRVEENPDTKRPVRISVSDYGLGILPEDLPYIFDPFYQGRSPAGAKSQGVGLGLALTKDMVEAIGGRISVNTRAGRGTTFTLLLQAAGKDSTDDGSQNTAH